MLEVMKQFSKDGTFKYVVLEDESGISLSRAKKGDFLTAQEVQGKSEVIEHEYMGE